MSTFDTPLPEAETCAAFASLDAENGLIGGLLMDNQAFDRISDRLRAEHFSTSFAREIYSEIALQINAGQWCDVVTVGMALDGRVTMAQLNALAQFVPSSANIRRYADVIIERFKSRALMAVSAEISGLARDHDRTIEDRVEAAQGQLVKLIDEAPRDEWISAYEGMNRHTQVLEDRADGKITAWGTGLSDLDDLLEGGFRPGELIIVGARPSMGKTALAMTIGLHMAANFSVAMLSMEMPHTEVRDRMTAMLGNVSLSHVKRPSRGLQWDRVVEGVERAKHINFYVSDQGGLNINQVRSKARNIKRLHGLNVLIVDYIGLMNGLDAKQQRAYQLEEISRGLKTLAKELEMTVLCLAQVNRKVEERIDATPQLSDLRDSGAIEQDADVVVFVHRPIQAKPELGGEWMNYSKASIAKNRNGRCGVINLHYLGEQTKFSGWAGPAPQKVNQSKRNDL